MISDADLASLLESPGRCHIVSAEGNVIDQIPIDIAVLPGSFNPVHEGHWQLATAAQRMLGRPVMFELSIRNVDKADLSVAEVRARLAQFQGRAPIAVTCAPRFVDKASLFPKPVFVVGADTMVRLIEPRYYGGDSRKMQDALTQIDQTGCRFLVAGRKDASGRWISLADISAPDAFRHLFTEIPPEEFCCDTSSSALRKSGKV